VLRNVTFLSTYCKILSSYTKCKSTYIIYDQFEIGIVQASHGRFITYRRFCDYMNTLEYYDLKFVCKNGCKPRALLRPILPYTDSPWTLHTTHVLLQLYIWKLFFLDCKFVYKNLHNQATIRTCLAPLGRFILPAGISHYM
jgi:hypothetical protein